MKVLISLPIFERDWILPYWFNAIEQQSIGLENIGFQFELGPDDQATHEALWAWHDIHPEVLLFDTQLNIQENHATHLEGQRAWKPEEYMKMVTLRNSLLERASERMDDFDYYLSLDSDVLITDPYTLEKLINHGKDVVSPLMFMTPYDKRFPNAMNWASKGNRYVGTRVALQDSGLQQVDVPMAAVMMTSDVAKNTRYQWHAQGEDIGFAINLDRNDYDSYLDIDTYTPHIMHRYHLEKYLKEGDDRVNN